MAIPRGYLLMEDITALTNKRLKPVKTSYKIQEQINDD